MKPQNKLINLAEQQFKDKAIVRNNLLLFNKLDMIEIIHFCKEMKIEIFGFDGFLLHPENKIQPSMEHSIDFSNTSYWDTNDDIYSAAISFIKKQGDNYVFEIVTA